MSVALPLEEFCKTVVFLFIITEVHSLVSEGLELKMKMESERTQQHNVKRMHAEFRERMSAHRRLVGEHESTEPVRLELTRQQNRIAALTAQSTSSRFSRFFLFTRSLP
ncbi:Hypp1252 [Branchiostoma lanceolatum]|uniref:Hypp1252 protein n=1 Tax=Branchiostoma lanceolatum TaxID=7740 RepID=A0A8J9ZFT6_BRALA|nr:Hypp1252 [Branchiostoma lanceolatum]